MGRVIARPIQIGLADKTDQTRIALLIGGNQHDRWSLGDLFAMIALLGRHTIFHLDIQLASQNGLQPFFRRLDGKFQSAEQIVAVCYANGRLPVGNSHGNHRLQRQCAFQQGIGGMDSQVYKSWPRRRRIGHICSFIGHVSPAGLSQALRKTA